MKKLLLPFLIVLGFIAQPLASWAGNPSLPFQLVNSSPFPDTDLYVAVVGINPSGDHVWVNPTNSQVLPMSSSYNTVTGPTYNGNTGPGANSKYANCFFKLSTIPNKTFTLPYIAGCRVYISRGQQLYFYFFGANGATSGYSGPDPQNPTDPNKDIIFESIELTNNDGGFFGNTTRVDAFAYPMGLELYGSNYYKKTGELKTAAEIVSAYQANVPSQFQSLLNTSTGVITCPGKSPAFQPGGAQASYFNSYIDAIWNKYKTTDLIFYAGNAGVFKGRVDANNRLVVVGQSGAFTGRTGIIPSKPTQLDMLEARGALATGVSDVTVDLVVQAQVAAAINRHIVNTTAANPGQQNWYDAASYYPAAPMNYYARFWHLPGISVDNLSYGFAYDDVNDQSSTLQNPNPTRVVATWGGFAGSAPTTGVATFYKDCNYSGASVSLAAGNYTLSQLQAKGILNDDISSLRVSSGYQVVLYENDNFTGASLTVNADNSCLVGNALGTGNWNDKTTSLKVQAAGSSTFSVLLQAEAANVNNGMVVETCSDTGGGQNMGYIDPGDYLVWNNISFPTSGSYLIEYRVASGASGGTISSDLNAGATQLGNTAVPATGGWQTWTTVSKTVTVNAGTYNFGVFAQTGGYNLNWVRISKAGSARAAAPTPDASAAEVASEIIRPDVASAAPATVALYPNPVQDRLQLHSTQSLEGAYYQIIDSRSRSVASGSAATGTLDVAELPTGIYTLILTSSDGKSRTMHRFVK